MMSDSPEQELILIVKRTKESNDYFESLNLNAIVEHKYGVANIIAGQKDMERLISSPELRREIVATLRKIGWFYVVLDLEHTLDKK
ncbi:MAG: hypothetical protein HYT16_01540 [DPANN group archaeon]|nr:hypothetical protein [DPANN group archaeon]